MRSTMKISANTTLNNILKDYASLFNVQNQMATGKRVNRPSDDPLAANEGLRLGTIISRVTQYNRNITTGNSFLGLSDGKLSNMSSLITSAKGLTVSSASETTTHQMRQANTVEIQSILQEIVTLANAEEAGRYLFGGTVSNKPPYEVVGAGYVYYRGNEQDIKIQTDSASFMNINTTGEDVFGSMTSTISSRDMSPQLIMGPSYATRLEDLNNGLGIPGGSINIRYSAYPDNGLNIDLTDCDTIEDIANKIEEATKAASNELNPDGSAGAPITYLAKRYVKVELNEDGSGLQLIETDPVWETTEDQPEKRPPDYPGFDNPSKLVVSEVGGGLVATRLGIKGTALYKVDPLNVEQTIPQPIEGSDLDPRLDSNTLLADMEDYVDRSFTISNGALPSKVGILEITDTLNSYSDWNLNGLSKGINTDKDGELYIRTEETYSGSGEYYINIYKDSSAIDSELVAQGTYSAGLIELEEKNNSGVNGSVAMPLLSLPVAPVTIKAKFDETFSATISVPAFESTVADATYHDVMSEFRMRGMQRGGDPMSKGTDTCSYTGDFYLEIENTAGALPPNLEVTVYNSQSTPRSVIATGTLPDGLDSGMVELEGIGNFDYLTGSVYVDWNKNINGGVEYDSTIGYEMKSTFSTVQDLMNEINASNTYTSARISEDGKGLDIVSHLAGAHMIITEDIDRVNHYNDYGQLGTVDLDNIIKGYNTDYDGNIYSNITTVKGADTIVAGIGTLTTYTTSVDLYNNDPRDDEFDPEKSLVAQASTEAALDSATGTWYQYDAVNDTWNAIAGYPANTALSINQTNNSGLSGTLELNSIRMPSAPYSSTTYFNYDAASGEKDLDKAIVLGTNSDVFNETVSPDGDSYNLLERTDLSNLLQGINTDNDGNLQTTVGFKVSNDDAGQVCKLDLSGIDYSTNTDATGKLYGVTSYAIDGDGNMANNKQIQQLQIDNFTRGKESTLDGKIYAVVDATGLNEVLFYNDDPLSGGQIVGRATPIPAAGGVMTITPDTTFVDSKLTGSFYIPAGAVDDSTISIDLERGSVMLYNDPALDPANLVAAGNSDTAGEVTFSAMNASGITGTSQFPTTGTDKLVQYDDNITIDTNVREVVLYAGGDYTKRVAKGELPSYGGGQVELLALNNSKISGSLYFNTVVEDTDLYNQVQNLELDGIQLGTTGNTSANGMLYMEVVATAAGWDVNIYDSAGGAGLVANGVIDTNTGIATITDGGSGSGISGSVRIGNPPDWNPQVQTVADGRIAIDVGVQEPDLTIYPQRGLQNSGENREENIFTTLNDVMIGMNNDDVEALHDLLEKFEDDHNRVLTARADIGTRVDRLDMLTQRHDDELINFQTIRSENLDLDYSKAVVEYQMAQNVFDAALRTTAQIMPMSLVDYI